MKFNSNYVIRAAQNCANLRYLENTEEIQKKISLVAKIGADTAENEPRNASEMYGFKVPVGDNGGNRTSS